MYSKELESIIEAALADGVLTDKEREVLHRRAAQEGVDADELDVVIEGKLAKMKQEKDWLRPTPPATEKRGNIVKCPNCGAPIQAGAVKCNECGYVFTNVQANSSMERLQQGIADITKRYDTRIDNASDEEKNFLSTSEKQELKYTMHDEIENYIMHFPIPSSKEDLIEFTTALNGFRRQEGRYESAYRAKFKECIMKIKTLFPGDSQMMELVKQTDTKLGRLSSGSKAGLSVVAIIAIMGIAAVIASISDNYKRRIDSETIAIAQAQCDSLCTIIDQLPVPDKQNYKEVENKLLSINWKIIDCPNDATDRKVNGGSFLDESVKFTYIEKKRAFAEQVFAVYLDLYHGDEDEAKKNAPKSISYSDLYIKN